MQGRRRYRGGHSTGFIFQRFARTDRIAVAVLDRYHKRNIDLDFSKPNDIQGLDIVLLNSNTRKMF